MFVRVVRFTDVTPERLESTLARMKEAGGPPPGVPGKGIQVLADADQGTVVVLQQFASADDLAEGERILGAMDAGETPGTRASVDRCEQRFEMRA